MKNTLYSTLITLIIAITLTFTTNTPAQESPQWHLPDGATARFGKGTIHQITYSPDSTKMAVATSIGIWIYDTETGDELNLLSGHTEAVDSVAFHPDGDMLASGSRDDTVRLWDVETGIEIRSLTAHKGSVYTVAFSHDGTTLASGSYDRTVRLWDTDTGTEIHTLTGHTRSIEDIAFNHDSTMLASTAVFENIRLWDVATGTERRTFADHSPSDNTFLNLDTKIQATANIDYSIRLWYTETGMTIHILTGHTDKVTSIAFSPDRTMLVSGSDDRSIRLWDVATGTLLHIFETSNVLRAEDVAFSPDGKKVAGLLDFMNSTVNLYDVETGQRVLDFTVYRLPPLGAQWPKFLPTEHTRSVRNLMFSPDGKSIITNGYDDTVRFWDSQTGTHLRVLRGHTDSPSTMSC